VGTQESESEPIGKHFGRRDVEDYLYIKKVLICKGSKFRLRASNREVVVREVCGEATELLGSIRVVQIYSEVV
jgi:hypothetical protein